MLSSNYILADKKITEVLKAVTASKLFFGLISFCAEGFDYSASFNRAFKNGEFIRPAGDKELIALGFYLFSDFDSKRADLFKMLEAYFPAENYDKSYKEFCTKFLIPFKNAAINSAKAMLELEGEDGELAFGAKNSGADEQKNGAQGEQGGRKIYSTCFADVQKIIVTEREKILQAKVKEDKKSDVLTILTAFKDCLFLGDKSQIRVAFLSYKYAIMTFKRFDSDVEDIERILKFCKIL